MARFVKYGEFDKLELGMPVDSAFNQIHGGQLEDGTAVAGDVLVYGTKTGSYKKASNITDAAQVAGVLAGDRGRMNLTYGQASSDYVKGDAVNVLTQGYIAVKVDKVAGIKEGDPVCVTSAGVFTKTPDSNIKLNAIFTGETTGTNIAGIKLL